MDDLVSIIMPAYNSGDYIRDAIISVIKQTYHNLEVIVVDDYSTDNTVEIVHSLIKEDNRIKLIKLSENKGAFHARNIALNNSKGRFIAFLDSDDLWVPNKLEKQLKFMVENRIGFSFTNYRMIKEDGTRTSIVVECPKTICYQQLLKNTIIGCLTVILDTSIIGRVTMPEIKPEDTALWLAILKNGFKAYCLQEELAYYRLVKGSVSSNRLKAAKRMWKVYVFQEKIKFPLAVWYFSNYCFQAVKKHYLNVKKK